MLELNVMVTPSLPSGKKLDGVGPFDNRPSTNKDKGPIHLCLSKEAARTISNPTQIAVSDEGW